MRIFRYKREKTLSTHNFGSHQIYVCELSNVDGNIVKGITTLNQNTLVEVPYPMDYLQAENLKAFLLKIINNDLPCKVIIKCGFKNSFINLYFEALSFANGEVKTKILNGNFFGINWLTASIKISSIESCLASLNTHYRDINSIRSD